MNANRTDIRALIGTACFVVVSTLYATVHISSNDWFGSADSIFALIWSLFASPGLYVVLRAFDRRMDTWSVSKAYGVATLSGILFGTGWTLIAAVLTGGWLGVPNYPVLLSWLSGALASFALCAAMRRPSTWPLALFTAAFPILVLVIGLQGAFEQPPDILVELRTDATEEEVVALWSHIRPIEETMTVYRFDTATTYAIGVSFYPGTSVDRRAEIIAEIRASGLVARVSEVDALEPGTVRGRVRTR
jgi:hypothetical protein